MAEWFIYIVSLVISLLSVWESRVLWKSGNKSGSVATCFLSLSIIMIIVLLILEVKISGLF
ncbi:hypothetical protein [Pontibacillus marinus]|uniref:Uncharacterized protein n=1 Tax=Pontibacillus marinus BH030004 = DSM 16465 TaxID=1385511 RepID=A0A0A5GFC1_9BACI|nr:hypothetical protein [Pontibacillus marinus]KGX91911.1 hypothetical protein N783_01030 [Pontibacillus marinus BH030004 = DSM 16465]